MTAPRLALPDFPPEEGSGPRTSTAVIPRPREATARALLTGGAIGVVLAAGNVYTGLKTSFIDGGSITAALLGFTFFASFKHLARRPYTALENNITQTTAASAAIMGFVLGLSGPIPALSLLGNHYPGWALVAWGIALGLVGIFIGVSLRKKLVITENLPFPTGTATAEVIETMSTARETAIARARILLLSALLAALLTWFRDGLPGIIPGATMLPGTVAGIAAGSLTLGVSWSPLMASTGMFMGFRNAASMLLGGVITWAVIAPRLASAGIVPGGGYANFVSWLVWPGLGLMTASTLIPLVEGWRSIVRSLRDLPAVVLRKGALGTEATTRAFPLQKTILGLSLAIIVAIGWHTFQMNPVITLLALALSIVLAGVCGRAAGETDLAPIGSAGMLTQLVFSGYGPNVSLFSGAIASGDASQTAQTLWALKAGHRLKASANAQIAGQIVGAILGALVVVPVYFVLVKTYGVGTEAMPAPSALSWKATAEAVRGGLGAMPRYGVLAGVVGVGLGVVLSLLGRTRIGRFLPSPMAMGIAVLTPASLSVAAFAGALVLLVVRRMRPGISDSGVAAVAAGGIAGESIMGVLVAALLASGIL